MFLLYEKPITFSALLMLKDSTYTLPAHLLHSSSESEIQAITSTKAFRPCDNYAGYST